ncbi:MAG: hypothetical protein GY866_15645 [Proteobacteria bacterium]|nr:hypothetical protein [Pseudomonadota bacterium]
MNFRGHLVGGVVAGAVVVGVALVVDYVSLNSRSLGVFIENPLNAGGDIPVLIKLFLITCFMSLFPDLDTATVPQRWFFRTVFVVLGILFLIGQMDLFAALTFLALLPILHMHRGWTHSKVTPFLVAAFLAIVFEYYRTRHSWFGGFSWKDAAQVLQTYWIYVLACVLGHYTHLFLDSR